MEYLHALREDAEAINNLYNKVFQQDRSLDHYLWKYWENPAGAPTGMIARERATGKCVATGIGQRRRGWVNGHDTYGALMCESATDPDMRGGGRLWRDVMNGFAIVSVDIDGIPWVFGGQSTDEAIKIGERWFSYRVIVELVPWEIRLSGRPALQSRFGKLSPLLTPVIAPVLDFLMRARWQRRDAGIQTIEVERFSSEYDELWERYRDYYPFCFNRNAETLNWRFADNPQWQHRILEAREAGKLVGYVVWREWNDSGVRIATVLDIWHGKNRPVLEALLDGARRKAMAGGSAFLRFAVQDGSDEQQVLKSFRSGRKSPFESVDKIIFTPSPGSNPLGKPEHVYKDLCVLMEGGANWHYTQGDCDFRD